MLKRYSVKILILITFYFFQLLLLSSFPAFFPSELSAISTGLPPASFQRASVIACFRSSLITFFIILSLYSGTHHENRMSPDLHTCYFTIEHLFDKVKNFVSQTFFFRQLTNIRNKCSVSVAYLFSRQLFYSRRRCDPGGSISGKLKLTLLIFMALRGKFP